MGNPPDSCPTDLAPDTIAEKLVLFAGVPHPPDPFPKRQIRPRAAGRRRPGLPAQGIRPDPGVPHAVLLRHPADRPGPGELLAGRHLLRGQAGAGDLHLAGTGAAAGGAAPRGAGAVLYRRLPGAVPERSAFSLPASVFPPRPGARA